MQISSENFSTCKTSDEKKSAYLEGEGIEKQGEGVGVDEYDVIDYMDELYDGFIEFYLDEVKLCGSRQLRSRTKDGQIKMVRWCCRKIYCRKCGGTKGFLHRKRAQRVFRKLGDISNQFIRQFVFTIPKDLRQEFMSTNMLKRLLGIVKRLMKKEFGVLVKETRRKKSIKRKYRLTQKVLASIELFGKKLNFNPHVNVLIFEEKSPSSSMKITKGKLRRIKKSYKNALEHLLSRRIERVVIHYSYKTNLNGLENSIRYMIKPMPPEVIKCPDPKTVRFVILGLKGFRSIRYWGDFTKGVQT